MGYQTENKHVEIFMLDKLTQQIRQFRKLTGKQFAYYAVPRDLQLQNHSFTWSNFTELVIATNAFLTYYH